MNVTFNLLLPDRSLQKDLYCFDMQLAHLHYAVIGAFVPDTLYTLNMPLRVCGAYLFDPPVITSSCKLWSSCSRSANQLRRSSTIRSVLTATPPVTVVRGLMQVISSSLFGSLTSHLEYAGIVFQHARIGHIITCDAYEIFILCFDYVLLWWKSIFSDIIQLPVQIQFSPVPFC